MSVRVLASVRAGVQASERAGERVCMIVEAFERACERAIVRSCDLARAGEWFDSASAEGQAQPQSTRHGRRAPHRTALSRSRRGIGDCAGRRLTYHAKA